MNVTRLRRAAAFALVAASLTVPAHAAPVDPQVRAFARTAHLTERAAADYFALTRAVGDLQARGAAGYAATFAGVWRTPSDGGLVHLAFTRDAAASAARLTAAFPRRDLVRVTTAATSLRDLQALAARVDRDTAVWHDAGVHVGTVGVDVVTGAVAVGTASPLALAERVVATRYPGLAVRVHAEGPAAPGATLCTSHASCPLQAVGGIELLGTVGTDVFACSSGFDATQVSTGAAVLVTAGHCFPQGGVALHSGIPVGQVATRVWPGGDAEAIAQLPGVYPATNSVLWTNAGAVVNVLGVVGHGVSEAVGAPVCRTGITTENQCGVIQRLNVTVNYVTGQSVTGLTESSACVQPGDSGGPYMSGNDAYGIASGGTIGACSGSTHSYYNPTTRIESSLGVRINT